MKKMNIITALIILVFTSNVFAGSKNEDKKNKVKTKAEKVSEKFDVEMKLEAWMAEIKDFNPYQKDFNEQEIVMERWMTETFAVTQDDFQESEITMEKWMTMTFVNRVITSTNSLDEPLEMEAWMTEIFEIK